jgi:monofunctional biosynthetic peptidoglycan transglycosylase
MKSKKKKRSFGLFKTLFVLFLLCILGGVAFYSVYPNIGKLKRANPGKTAFMEYREREWESKGKKVKIRKQWVAFSGISPYAVKAVIIAEDDKFWSHQGFDFDAMEKALEKDLEAGKMKFGASTISQQLVKNLYLSPSKNPVRKLVEALITWRMEKTLSKRRIIELYLNVAEWGEGIFGIEAAAQHYFGTHASALGPEQAARLAVVLPNPRRFNANGSSRYVQKRAQLIYRIMVRRGIVVEEYEEAAREPEEAITQPAGGNNPPAESDTPTEEEAPSEGEGQ